MKARWVNITRLSNQTEQGARQVKLSIHQTVISKARMICY